VLEDDPEFGEGRMETMKVGQKGWFGVEDVGVLGKD
jgi:hypothetical protein